MGVQLRTEQEQLIKIGKTRVQDKIKKIRGEYTKAVRNDCRSGSRKIVQQYWEKIKKNGKGQPM